VSTPNVVPAEGALGRRGDPPRRRQEGTRAQAGRAATAGAIARTGARHVLTARIVDDGTDRPIRGARYQVLNQAGDVVASGTTRHDGMVRHELPEAGEYTVQVVELPAGEPGATPGAGSDAGSAAGDDGSSGDGPGSVE